MGKIFKIDFHMEQKQKRILTNNDGINTVIRQERETLTDGQTRLNIINFYTEQKKEQNLKIFYR